MVAKNNNTSTDNEIAALQELLREQKATIFQLKSVIDNIPGDVYWKNSDGVYLGLNVKGSESLRKMGFRWDVKDIIGKTDYDLYDPQTADSFRLNDQQVMQCGFESVNEESAILPSGDKIVQLSIKRPLYDENKQVVGMVGNTIDITYLKNIESNLRLAKEAADAASQAKTMFLANMSHDLKTPLAGIISTAEYLSQSLSQPEAKNRANDIVQSGLRLLELLVEIIEVSRLDSKVAHELSTFDPRVLVTDIMQLIKPVIVNKNLTFKTLYQDNIPNLVIGDRWQLYRIILNLLSNAIKFTSEGSIILMALLEKRQDDEVIVKIIVKDTGIGIPIDKQAVIFEQFTRLTNAYDSTYKGTGLGLYIVKTFVESMQGQIQVESEEGKGSTFTCLIPLQCTSPLTTVASKDTYTELFVSAEQSLATNDPGNDHAALFAGANVLLVEDNVIAARATKDILQSLGCHVDTAASGQEALRLFKRQAYHFVYLDIGLPDMNGREVSQYMRQVNDHVPIVALSAHIDETIRAECLAAGMDDVLAKPLLREHAKHNMQAFLQCAEGEAPSVKSRPSVMIDKIIDLELAASILGSDLAGAESMLSMIMEQLPEYHCTIEQAFQQGDKLRLAKAAHKLHGGLVYGGVVCLQKAVAALEQAAYLADNDVVQRCYDTYQEQLVRLNEMYARLYVE